MGSTQNLVIHKRGTMAGRLGIIDWGIGGVSIYKLIKEQIGDVPVTYLSDTGATPYGKMSRPELTARLDSVIEYLKGRGVTHIIIGCNAASTAIPHLADHAIPVDGVIVPATKMAAKLKPTKLGLIGGRRTVVSGVYRRLLKAQNIEVKQRIAQPLSALIESGDVVSETLRCEAKRILAPLKNCSHILLACTHYPAITPLLRQLVSPQTIFIDPAAKMVEIVRGAGMPLSGGDTFLTTGDAQMMRSSAQKAFGVAIASAESISI